MRKEQIVKKNKEKEELRLYEDYVANRVMFVFASAILMLLGLSKLWRGYEIGATLLAAIEINKILNIASAVLLAGSLVWWILSVRKGTFKKQSVLNGAMFSGLFAALLASSLLISWSPTIAQKVLYVVIPGVAILHLIYSSYQREFFCFCTTHAAMGYLMWLMVRTYNPTLKLTAVAAILGICALSVALFLLARKNDGELALGPVRFRLMDNRKIEVKALFVLYGLVALLGVLAYLLGAPYAYYCLYALIGLVIGMAVYYTVKLI